MFIIIFVSIQKHSPLAHRLICRDKRVHSADRENMSPSRKMGFPVPIVTNSEEIKCKLFSPGLLTTTESRVLSPIRKPVLSEITSNRRDRVSEDITDDSQVDLDQAFVKTDSMQAYVYKSEQGEPSGV
jgi:hypothetical protein